MELLNHTRMVKNSHSLFLEDLPQSLSTVMSTSARCGWFDVGSAQRNPW